MDPEIIKARRERIESASWCDGCGSTLEWCKAHRGRDKTAPSWFGCCGRGLGEMLPCRHVPDARELIDLIKEIERGEVTSPEDLMADELLASISEYPLFELSGRGRSLRSRVMAMAADNWPDDVPMPGGF